MEYFSNLKAKLIYVFRIPDAAHSDCLKIGEATFEDGNITLQPNSSALNKAAKARIDQYTKTAGITYELLHTEIALYVRDGKLAAMNDKEVHDVLLRSGIKRKVFDKVNGANEWFCCDLETAKRAIAAVKKGRKALKGSEVTVGQSPIVFRPEQREAIDKTIKQFKKGKQMLWNAKMRFGKTLSALQVVKERGDFRRVLILTHRPVVDAGWFEDFQKIFYDNDEYAYGSKTNGDTFVNLERRARRGECRYIYFASMQDLRGSELVGGNFDKNNDIFSTPWDLIIVDEAHEGTQTELGKAVMAELTKEKTKVLRLSGTPFNLLDDFKEEEIYTWDYVMEQRAKAEWDLTHPGDHNPYAGLPRLNIVTFENVISGHRVSARRVLNEFIPYDIFPRYNEATSIIHKVLSSTNYTPLSKIIAPYKPFGLRTYERGFEVRREDSDLVLHTSKGIGYVERNSVTASVDYVNAYNVITGKALSGHLGETDENGQVKVLATTKVIAPNEVCTESYIAIGKFDTDIEANNAYKYLCTKFSRFLLLQALPTLDIRKERFIFVPMQEFTASSDIDWNKSIEEIDAQLYAKYNLSDEEIAFIESMIKPM